MIKYRGLYLFAGLLVVGALIIIYLYPKQIHTELKGVSYQIGADWDEEVTISIEGKLKRKLWGGKTFVGTIDISGEDIPVPEQHRELTIKLNSNWSPFVYVYYDNGKAVMYSYGILFSNHNLSELTILKYKEDEDRPNGKGWHGTNGLMITAPAVDRVEALELSSALSEHSSFYGTFIKEIKRVETQ